MGRNKKKIKWKPLHFKDDEESEKTIRRKKVDKSFGKRSSSFERNSLTLSPITSEPKLNSNSISSRRADDDDDLRDKDYVACNEFQCHREHRNVHDQPPLPPFVRSLFVPYQFINGSSLSLTPFPYHLFQNLGTTFRPHPPNLAQQPTPSYEEEPRAEFVTKDGYEGESIVFDVPETANFVPNYTTTPPFVLEPLIYAPSHFNAYPWWPSRQRRRQQPPPPRYGGEGISYDRWPSRIKCSKTSESKTDIKLRNVMEEYSMMPKKTEKATDGIANVAYETNEMQVSNSRQNGFEKDEATAEMEEHLNRFVIVESLLDVLVDKVVVLAESSKEKKNEEMEENLAQQPSSAQAKALEGDQVEEEQLPTESYMGSEDDSKGQSNDGRSKYANYYHLCSEMVDDGSMSPVTMCSLEGDVIVHDVDDDDVSECGSEDVEMVGHRYETTAEKLYKANQVSLAIELLSAKQGGVPYDTIVTYREQPKSCYTNTQVLEGFYGEMKRDKKKKRGEMILDSGIHTSDEEGAEEDKINEITSEDEEILFERDESGKDSFEYQRFGNGRSRRRAQKTPLIYLGSSDSWYGCCCIIM